MARKDVTPDIIRALGNVEEQGNRNEQRLDALIVRLDKLAERVTKIEDGTRGTDRCLVELYKAVGKLSEALDVKLDEGADMAGAKPVHEQTKEELIDTAMEARDKQAAEELFRQSCERALPAYIRERKAWAKEQSLATLSHRVSNMVDREDPRMTDLDGLLIMREWVSRVPSVAFTQKFAAWLKVNKPLILRFAHRLHEGEQK